LSTTPESDLRFAAGLIADAIVGEAAASTGHRRLVLRTFLGVPTADIFAALAERIDPQAAVLVNAGRQPVTLQAIPLPGDSPGDRRLLVPYLVGEAGPNSGTAGFGALLRDEVPVGAGRRVLLILDSTPVETVRTAAEDAATLSSLQWQALAHAAIAGSLEPLKPLLKAILADDAANGRLPRTHAALGALRRLAQLTARVQAGLGLPALGCYVADPEAHSDPVRRLRTGARWRVTLEGWMAPGQDLERSLTNRYPDGSDPRLARVLASVTPFGLDYSQFTLDDLPATKPQKRALRLAYPITAPGTACTSLATRAVIWKPGGGSISISLAAPASADGSASITWSDGGSGVDIPIAAGDREIELSAEGTGWRFGRLQLASGATAELAVFLDEGRWAPFEAGLDLDLNASAFHSSSQPRLLALGPSGELAGQPVLQQPSDPGTDREPELCQAIMAGEQHPISLLIELEPADDDDESTPAGTEDDAGGTASGGTDSDDEVPQLPTGPAGGPKALRVPSVAHALLAARKQGKEPGAADFFVTVADDGLRTGNIVTPGRFDLSSQNLAAGLDGLNLERQILANPQITAFALNRAAGAPALIRHSSLDTLDVSGLPGFDDFMTARVAFFRVVAAKGSVHALGAGVGEAEAEAYLNAYSTLLEALVDGRRFSAEYEKLFLCDAVTDGEYGELLIAPTSPLSVSYLLALTGKVNTWLPRASEVLSADLEAFTMRHLIPYFSFQENWYETGAPAPLLWRRYRPSSIGISSDHKPGYIADRVNHFMRVHPEYRDARQRLALAFHEPGNGAMVLQALRELVRPYIQAPAPLPRLAVTIVSSSTAPTVLEALASGQVQSREADTHIDRLLQDKLDVVRVTPDDGRPEFAHLSFVFESTLHRQPATVGLGARASTLFVNGLAAAPGRHIEPGRNETTFMWGTFTGSAPSSQLAVLTHTMLELVSGMPRDPIAQNKTRMPSMQVRHSYLESLYTGSAWVVHLDKLLGLEAFAPNAAGRHARYLIDYEDRLDPAQPGLDAITATNRVEPYRRALRQALAELGPPADAGLDRFLQLFNSVSGHWALDLVGANPSELHERIGLACAIAALQDLDGGLSDDRHAGVVVAIDEILGALPSAARPSKDRICDDLLYIRVPFDGSQTVVLRGRILEVKYRGATDPGAAEYARKQLERAHKWLLATFNDKDTPQREFRARDLSELLRAAATRASAFGLLKHEDRAALESAFGAVSRGEFELRLDYQVGSTETYGDFVSIEGDSAVPAHRQPLPGAGLPLGHLRLGRPALQALAAGKQIPRPGSFSSTSHNSRDSQDQGEDGPAARQSDPAAQQGQTAEMSDPTSQGEATDPITQSMLAEVPIVAARLDAAFAKYGLSVEPFSTEHAQVGPSVVRFRTRSLGRLSIADVERKARDIGREIAAPGPVQVDDEPGFLTVDVPRTERDVVPLLSVLSALDAEPVKPGALPFVAGVAPSGRVEIADLSRLPHLLVAGATGSGKSVFLRGLLAELLRARTPEQLHLLIIDPKRLDFAAFARAPHVRGNAIISDPDEALELLAFTLESELSLRQPILEEAGVTSAAEYYEAGGRLEDLPQLVILVDEFADLVLAGSNRKAFSELVQRYAQLTRAYGIFLVLATQRPTVDVVTGSIKANLSARIAFSLPSGTDSRTVLDRNGAEDLLGDGDLLFYRNGRIERLQAPFTTIADVRTMMS
jgi:hypothetical protein